MFKELIDVDVKKVAILAGFIVAFGLPIASGQVPLHNVVPDSWIPHIEAVAGVAAWAAGIIVGSHNIAALISPRAS